MQSEPLDGDASHMRAVNSTNIARLGDVSKVIRLCAEENGHTFTQSERMAIAGTIVLRDIDDPQRRLDLSVLLRRCRRLMDFQSSTSSEEEDA
jgi:hypothetical protein